MECKVLILVLRKCLKIVVTISTIAKWPLGWGVNLPLLRVTEKKRGLENETQSVKESQC